MIKTQKEQNIRSKLVERKAKAHPSMAATFG